MTPTFSLLLSTARQHLIPETMRRWFNSATARWGVEFVICTDGGNWRGEWDGTLNKMCRELKIRRSQVKIGAIKVPPFSSNRCWNLAAKICTGNILVMVADDLMPQQGWDSVIANSTRSFDSESWVLWADDGTEDQKLTHPIMSRKRYEEQGCFLFPLYNSMYDDTDLWRQAQRDGVVIDARDVLTIEHQHHYFGKREEDAVDKVQASPERYAESERLYLWRKQRGFPKYSGLVPKSKSDYAVYMQVIKDDFFLYEILERLVYEGVTKFFFSIPLFSWDGKQVYSEDVTAILDASIKLKHKYGCKIKCDYNWCHEERLSRIERETRVRNIALNAMREEGWPFALIVDSDELWVPGTLDKVHALASEGVQAIRVKMTTVAGMPKAYPIDGKDYANVYIGPDVEFDYCRNPVAPMHAIDEVGVYHFSAVRRTKELLVEKMKSSGHYGEAGYDFDKWLSTTLPAIKLGAENVHMAHKGKLWPLVREWEQKDIEVLPETIKQFLQL